jgi:hypothetical protein
MKTKEEIEQLAENSSYNNSEHFENYQDGMFYGYIKGYNQCQEDMAKDQTVTRFEVIDEYGRAYTDYYCKVELSYQDEGRTLKVIIKQLNKQD